MTSIFDKYSDLDPARMRKQIETAHGSPVFDQYSHDPVRAEVQMRAALGASFDPFSLLDPTRERVQIEASLSGGGGDTYVAKAVHFDGSTYLKNSSLVSPDATSLSVSYWFRNPVLLDAGNMNLAYTFVVDAENNFTTWIDNLPAGDLPDPQYILLQFALCSEAGAAVAYNSAPTTVPLDTSWHHVLFSGECGNASGSNTGKIFIDGVDVTGTLNDTHAPLTMVFNGKSFWFGTDSFGLDAGDTITGDIADFWLAPGVNLISDGTIPPETLAKFMVGGKPKDPTGFPAGGVVIFTGDADSFATNQGTGGTFATTGTLTDASTSPSD